MPACTPSTRLFTWTAPVERDAFLVAARHQPAPAGRRGAAMGVSRCPMSFHARFLTPVAAATVTCCWKAPLRPALEAGSAGWAGPSARWTPTPCVPRPRSTWWASTTSPPSARRNARPSSPVKTLRSHPPSASRGAYWRIDCRRLGLPAPHGAQHHGLPARRWAAGVQPPGLDGRGAGRPQPRCRRTDLSGPTACTSPGRTTMRRWACQTTRRRWTGCPEHMPAVTTSRPAPMTLPSPHPHQDLRPHP